MAEFRIGEIAARCGIAASAIRYYESEGLIEPPARRNGRRIYGEAIVDQLRLVELAKCAGFTLAEVRQLLAGFSGRKPPGERWRALTRAKQAELDGRIAEAERMKRVLQLISRCHCPTLADCSRALRSRRRRAS